MKTVILVRHAEAHKTLEKRHGGQGTRLTAQGYEDAERVAERILARGGTISPTMVLGSPIQQVAETATLVGGRLKWPVKIDARLKGIHMGIFDGLTDEETKIVDKAAAERLEMWRQRKLPVEEIKIPGAENINEFQQRIASVLAESLGSANTLLISGTRSVGIAVLNILTNGLKLREQGYIRYRLDPGSISLLTEAQPGSYQIVEVNSTTHLGRAVEYPDD